MMAPREGTPLSPSPSPPGTPTQDKKTQRIVIDITDSPPPPSHPQPPAYNNDTSAPAQPAPSASTPNPLAFIPDDPNQASFYRTAAAHFPPPSEAHAQLEESSKAVVGAFYDLAVRAADVDRGNEHLVLEQVNQTIHALANLSALARRPEINATLINPEALGMVDDSRNPDTHSRTLVNRLVSDNQQMRGQSIALHAYQSKLTAALSTAFPALAGHLPSVPDHPVWTESVQTQQQEATSNGSTGP